MKTKLQTPAIFFFILSILILSCGPVSEVILTPVNPDATPLAPGTESSDATAEPELSDIISADNANNLIEISSWGKGSGHNPTYSPDGTVLAASSSSGIYLYDSQTLQEGMYFAATDVLDMAFSMDGKTLTAFMSGTWEATVKQWDVTSGTELHSWIVDSYNDDYGISTGVLSPDGKTLAIIYDYRSVDGDEVTVKLWDAASGSELHGWNVYFPSDPAFSTDGTTLAVLVGDGTVTLYDVSSGSQLRTIATIPGLDAFRGPEIISLAFLPDGNTLAFSLQDGTVTLYDVSSGREVRTLSEDIGEVVLVTFSPDSKTLAGGTAGAIKLWDADSGNELLTINVSNLESLTFSPDGKTLVTASSMGDDSVKIWDTATGDLLNTLKGDDVAGNAIWSADSGTLAYAASDNTVRLRDVPSGEVRILGGHPGGIWSLAFSPDGKTLASASYENLMFPQGNLLKLWDVASGTQLHTLNGHTDTVSVVAFSPDGTMLASGSFDNTVKLWDVASGSEVRTLIGQALVYSMAIAPNGKILASASGYPDYSVRLWDIASGSELHTLSGHTQQALGLTFSPDSKLLISGSGDGTKLWDVASGQELRTLSTTWLSTAFSPDGKLLAIGFEDGTVKILDPASGDEIYSFSGHVIRVIGLAFSPDGRILAAGGETIKLWDLASGQELANLSIKGAYSLAFSPDGKLILVRSPSGISLWGVSP